MGVVVQDKPQKFKNWIMDGMIVFMWLEEAMLRLDYFKKKSGLKTGLKATVCQQNSVLRQFFSLKISQF